MANKHGSANRWSILTAIIATLLLGPLSPAPAQQIQTLMIKDPGEISDAARIDDALNGLVTSAAACRPRTEACICSSTARVDRLKAAYYIAVTKHPSRGLSSTGVEYWDPAKRATVGIVISNVRRQLEMCGIAASLTR